MDAEMMRDHARQMAAVYAFLLEDMDGYRHDPDAHNLCSAVVESGGTVQTLFSYSNPSGLPAHIRARYDFVSGEVPNKLINRGGMQDLHTEVRLINHLHDAGVLARPGVVTLFSSRSVCSTCFDAIMAAQRVYARASAFVAVEYKAELHGTITDQVYPMLPPGLAQARITYV